MSKSILVAFLLALIVTACGEGSCKAYTDRVNEQQDNACGHYLTNAQIIEETKLCNEAGLDAESLHCGDDHQTVIVQCKPRVQNAVQESAE